METVSTKILEVFSPTEDPHTFIHRELNAPFRLVPPGTVRFGLDSVERLKQIFLAQWEDIEESNEATWEHVKEEFAVFEADIASQFPATGQHVDTPLLVAQYPLTAMQAVEQDVSITITSTPNYDERYCPAALSFAEATQLCQRFGCRLPTEVEWEYLCRGSTDTFFIWGNELAGSNDPCDVYDPLKPWLLLDASKPEAMCTNCFGLRSLFGLEWCQDEYRESHAPNAPIRTGYRVAKGGGGLFYPWQVYEWMYCLPSWRHAIPDTRTREEADATDELRPGVRLVFPVDSLVI